jgi:hypothetical protein
MFPFHGTDTPVPAKAVAFKNCRLVIMRYVSYRVCAIYALHSRAMQIPPPSTPVVQLAAAAVFLEESP